jgi:hypothetical protein
VLVAELLEDRALQSHATPQISPRAVVVCGKSLSGPLRTCSSRMKTFVRPRV